jgi:hypothetical protein
MTDEHKGILRGGRGLPGLKGERGNQGNRGNPGETGETGEAGGLSGEQFRAIRRLLLCGLALFLIVAAYSTWVGYQGRHDQYVTQKAGCERGKLDRTDNAAFQRAYVRYNGKVTHAASVHEDVKHAARELRSTVRRTSASLASRTGPIRVVDGKKIGLDCQAIPKPSLLP